MTPEAATTLANLVRQSGAALQRKTPTRVAGEFIADPSLERKVPAQYPRRSPRAAGERRIFIGELVDIEDRAHVRDLALFAQPNRLAQIDAYCRGRLRASLAELSGRQVELEVHPELSHRQALSLRVHAVRAVGGEGCWTTAKSEQRAQVGVPTRPPGAKGAEARLVLGKLPTSITVVAPPGGRASRSDVDRELDTIQKEYGVQIHRPTDVRFVGPQAPESIAITLSDADTEGGLILLMRGGGGRADFWPFETAVVAKAIEACRSTVICALGHRMDRSLADEWADYSFSVPHVAAQKLTFACRGVTSPPERRFMQRGRGFQRQQAAGFDVEVARAESELLKARAALETARRDGAESERGRLAAIASRDRAQALAEAQASDLLRRHVHAEPARRALARRGSSVHLLYLTALPAALAMGFLVAGVLGIDGAGPAVWWSCAALFAVTAVVCLLLSRRFRGEAESLVTPVAPGPRGAPPRSAPGSAPGTR